ncbi:MAG: Hint domain-containing protein [Alphaproteobacteria bacterium]|nr:Hint domain-containing protein [Alphaproteobacteria bacterium]
MNVITAPKVTVSDLEVGSGGTATVVGGTNSTLYLWHTKNLVWENGSGNTVTFEPYFGLVPTAPGQLTLDLQTGQGTNPYGGTLQVSGVDNVIGGSESSEYILANNDGDNIQGGFRDSFDAIIGGSGNDTLDGYRATDALIVAGSGTATLAGSTLSGATNLFVYSGGADTITNFRAGAGSGDVLDLSDAPGVSGFTQAMGDATQSGNNTVLDFGNGHTITLDNVTKSTLASSNFVFEPIVADIQAPSGIASTGTVPITLTISDALTVDTTNGSPSLTLSDGATATYDPDASNPAGHLLVFDYAIGSGDRSPNLEIAAVNTNGAVIEDAAGHAVDFSAALNQPTGLQIGASPLTVTSVTTSPTGEADSGLVDLTLQMSEPVTVTGNLYLALNIAPALVYYNYGPSSYYGSVSTSAGYDSGLSTPSQGKLVFDINVDATAQYTPDLAVTGVTLAAGARVQDSAGYNADFSAATGATGLELGPPLYVQTLTTDAPAGPAGIAFEANAGQTVHLSLAMSEGDLTVNTSAGSPTMTLSDGATTTYDSGASNPSTGTLVFDYAIGSNDHSPDLTVTSVNLNGATITDQSGHQASFPGALYGFASALHGPTNVEINPSPLTVTGVSATDYTQQDGTPGFMVTLTMSESVTASADAGDDAYLVLNNGELAPYVGSGASENQLVFGGAGDDANISVTGVVLNEDLNNETATFQDANGYNADFSGALNVPTGVSGGDPLYVTSLSDNSSAGEVDGGQTVEITLGMSEGFTVAGGTPTLAFDNQGTATYDAAASNPTTGTMVFDYAPGAGVETAALDITAVNLNGATVSDAGGNSADFSELIDEPLQFEVGPSTVLTVAPSAIGTLIGGQTLQLDLVMSENVDIDTSNGSPTLALSNGGTATYDAALSAVVASDGPDSIGQIIFDYTVPQDDPATNLDIASVNLNGATITDVASGLPADMSGAVGAYLGIALQEVPCFCAGTRIVTERGQVAVEDLRVGDRVATVLGRGWSAIEWVGHRSIDLRRHRNSDRVTPIRVAAGAFGEGLPLRDLYLSPGHSVFVRGVLIPIEHLVNGATVAASPCGAVTYWHVELALHDVLLAEGLAAESYLDTGNRCGFENGGAFIELRPDFEPKQWKETCVPLCHGGAAVEQTKAMLMARASEMTGGTITSRADPHIVADGRRCEPVQLGDDRLAFMLPEGSAEIELVSRRFVPTHTIPASDDRRCLGLCIKRLQLDGREIPLYAEALDTGWHRPERCPSHVHRWTVGCTPLPAGTRLVLIDLAGHGRYWENRTAFEHKRSCANGVWGSMALSR